MTNELVKQESKEVVADSMMEDFGMGDIKADDIVIPKILPMQGLSKLVTDGKAKFGDFVDSITSTVIGDIDRPIEFIPFYMEKVWTISELKGSRFEFSKIIPVTAENENMPWEEVINGKKFKNEKTYNFYCIVLSDPTIPYLVQFKSTSARTGKELSTQMYIKNRAAKLSPAGKVMKLFGSRVTNDNGTFVVIKTSVERNSTIDEVKNCLEWYKLIRAGAVAVDNSDDSHAPSSKSQF